MKAWAKALIVIAVLAAGTISILLAPLLPIFSVGSEAVDYDAGVNQINFVANIDAASIRVEYDTSPTADLINVSWDLTVRHSVLVPPPVITVAFKNYTTASTLTAILTMTFQGLLLSAGLFSRVVVTINPNLISNFSITTTTGNINLSTSNLLNPHFIDVNFTCTTGNSYATFLDGSNIQGDINIITTTGNNRVIVGVNSNINGTLWARTTTGNNNVTLRENISLLNDFIVQATTGLILVSIENCNLNGQALTGIFETSSGNQRITITQQIDSNGNLTIDADAGTGNIRLILDFAITGNIESKITPTTSTGTISYGSLAGYILDVGYLYSQYGPQLYSINAALDSGSGNILLEGGYS